MSYKCDHIDSPLWFGTVCKVFENKIMFNFKHSKKVCDLLCTIRISRLWEVCVFRRYLKTPGQWAGRDCQWGLRGGERGRESGTPRFRTVCRRLLAPLSQAHRDLTGSRDQPPCVFHTYAESFEVSFFLPKFDLARGDLRKIGSDFTQRGGGSGEDTQRWELLLTVGNLEFPNNW